MDSSSSQGAPAPADQGRRTFSAALGAAAATACPLHAWAQGPVAVSGGLDPAGLGRVSDALEAAVQARSIPGAIFRIEREGQAWQCERGVRAREPQVQRLEPDTVYDVASLTKVVATTPVVMRLLEAGAIRLDDAVQRWLPAFEGGPGITLRHLLTHTSGLPAGVPADPPWQGRSEGLRLACTRVPTHGPGSFFRYSDVNFILLGAIAEQVGGQALNVLAAQWVFAPLGLRDTGFLPLERGLEGRVAPTEWDGATLLRGVVHDPTARRMGGVAGHAGLFSTAADLGRYARMLLGGGQLEGTRVLQESTVAQMTAVATEATLPERRGLGWDIDSPFSRARGKVYPLGSFGHTGFTGCSFWVDPFSRTAHVLLSNRVHPRARESIVALYEQVGTLAAQAVVGFDFGRVSGALPAR